MAAGGGWLCRESLCRASLQGIFFEGDIDCRQIYICPMHPGAQELPYHPKEHLKAPPTSGIKAGGNRRKRKQRAAARAADDGSGR